MANTNVTIRVDEEQAVREHVLPFQPRMINGNYEKKAYQLAMKNTKYNSEGKAVVEKK